MQKPMQASQSTPDTV